MSLAHRGNWDEQAFGRIDRDPVDLIAPRVARRIMEFASPRAVIVDKEARVWVVPAKNADNGELVGVYTRSIGMFTLEKNIRDDLGETSPVAAPSRRMVSNNRQSADRDPPNRSSCPRKAPAISDAGRKAMVRNSKRNAKKFQAASKHFHHWVIEGESFRTAKNLLAAVHARGGSISLAGLRLRLLRGQHTWDAICAPPRYAKPAQPEPLKATP